MEIRSGITFDPAENWRTSAKQDGNLKLAKTGKAIAWKCNFEHFSLPHIQLVFNVIPSDGVLRMGGARRLSSAPLNLKTTL